MQRAESDSLIAQSLRLEAQAVSRAKREPDAAGRANLTKTIENQLQTAVASRTEEMILLENTRAADRHEHETERCMWQCEIDDHKSIAKEWQDWYGKQSDDIKVQVEADLPGQDAQDGQQQEAESEPQHAAE